MGGQSGLRDRKKMQTRQRIADVAARLFAAHGYDGVSMAAVARASDVSEQTVYNYFTAKQDLVLDLADEIRGWYDQAIRTCGAGTPPARALEPILTADIDRYRAANLDEARGEFPAQSVESPALRRFTLEERERQVVVIATAMTDTEPRLPAIVARSHAAALVAVIHAIHDHIGTGVLHRADQDALADELEATAAVALDSLDRTYRALLATDTSDPKSAKRAEQTPTNDKLGNR